MQQCGEIDVLFIHTNRRDVILLLTAVLVLALLSVGIASAQARDSAVVRVYDLSSPNQSTVFLATFGPANPTPLARTDSDISAYTHFSPDGSWIAETYYEADGSQGLRYGKVGGPLNQVDAPENATILFPEFSLDNRLLAYSIADWVNVTWQLYLVELSSGSAVIFEGSMNSGDQLVGGVSPLAWSADGSKLYVAGVGLDGLATVAFEVDLSGVKFDGSTAGGLPPQRALIEPGKIGFPFYFVFSPDRHYMAFTYADSARQVEGYAGRGDPINTLGVVDLQTGESRVVVEAPANHTIDHVAWSADNAALIYTTSRWEPQLNAPAIATDPKLYAFVVATGGSVEPLTITDSPAEVITMILPCASTIYFAVEQPSQNDAPRVGTLYSAPLSDPRTKTALLTGAYAFSGVGCGVQ